MNEFAPEYSRQEKVRLIAINFAWVTASIIVVFVWFLPWIKDYMGRAHCYHYGFISGLQLLYYGALVFLPLLATLVFLILLGPRFYKVIKQAQAPLPNEKVFSKTRYVHGNKAKMQGYVFFLMVLMMIFFCINGMSIAQGVIMKIQFNPPTCAHVK